MGAVMADYWDEELPPWFAVELVPRVVGDSGYYVADQVAALFRVDRSTVDRWCRSAGRREILGAYRPGADAAGVGGSGAWRFRAEAVRLLLEG